MDSNGVEVSGGGVAALLGLEGTVSDTVLWAALTVLVGLVGALWVLSRRSGRGSRVFLVGPSGVGKSTLYYMLKTGDRVKTFPSMEAVRSWVDVTPSGADQEHWVELMDSPGHATRIKTVRQQLGAADCVVAVCSLPARAIDIKELANQHLYPALTSRVLQGKRTAVLLCMSVRAPEERKQAGGEVDGLDLYGADEQQQPDQQDSQARDQDGNLLLTSQAQVLAMLQEELAVLRDTQSGSRSQLSNDIGSADGDDVTGAGKYGSAAGFRGDSQGVPLGCAKERQFSFEHDCNAMRVSTLKCEPCKEGGLNALKQFLANGYKL